MKVMEWITLVIGVCIGRKEQFITAAKGGGNTKNILLNNHLNHKVLLGMFMCAIWQVQIQLLVWLEHRVAY
jgi:hypothetical protein